MKVALIGVGLIGTSAVVAWRRAGRVTEAIGYDLDPQATELAVRRGALDRAAASAAEAARGADLVLVAVPVGATADVLGQIAARLGAGAIVTDVGSTKRDVIGAARSFLPRDAFARFVPAHPIAGRETPGAAAADADLFRGRLVILTPAADTDADALALVESLWRAGGASVERMDADEHDRVFSAVSHLPHLLAFALVAQIAGDADGDRKFGFAGAGFRDFTRIAASSPVMWRDICLANRAALGADLRRYREQLERLQAAVDAGNAAALEAVFAKASDARRRCADTLDAG